jgi:hypothetical protein
VFPTSIRDANGNYITITYVNNQGPVSRRSPIRWAA